MLFIIFNIAVQYLVKTGIRMSQDSAGNEKPAEDVRANVKQI